MTRNTKIVIISGLVLLIGSGIGIYYYYKNKNKSKNLESQKKIIALKSQDMPILKSAKIAMTKEMMKK